MTKQISLFSAIAFGLLPPNLFDGDVGRLLMPFLALFMAGILPAISLTINSLKSGGYSVQRIQRLSNELRRLLDFLIALFFLSLLAAVTLLAGSALEWGTNWPYKFYTARAFNITLGILLGNLFWALPKLRIIFRTLLTISTEIAVDEATTKLRDRANKVPEASERFPTKANFGVILDVVQGEAK